MLAVQRYTMPLVPEFGAAGDPVKAPSALTILAVTATIIGGLVVVGYLYKTSVYGPNAAYRPGSAY